MNPRLLDLTGRTFGRLKVLWRDQSRNVGGAHWLCVCECGNRNSVLGSNLRKGDIRSCGCLRRELAVRRGTKHGAHEMAEYRAWQQMLSRCYSATGPDFHNYGSRGIKVAAEWRMDFTAFLRDIGPRPSRHHSLDRFPDNDGDYRPGNVLWATKKQQNRNQRRNIRVRIDGVTMTFVEAVELVGLNYSTARDRCWRWGWPLREALELAPSQKAEFVDAK